MKLIYPACFYEDSETKSYTVVVPDLPGCTTFGKNLSEAIEMGRDASCGWILDELESGKSIPKPSEINSVKLDNDLIDGKAFVSILDLDIESYEHEHSKKLIEKKLNIPVWVNAFVEKNNLNFSKILEDAIIKIQNKGKI